MQSYLLLCLIAVLCVECSAVVFHPCWCSYIAQLIQQHERCPLPPTIIPPPLPPTVSLETQRNQQIPLLDYFQPQVIIWDPFQQFPGVLEDPGSLVCIQSGCQQPLRLLRWQDGSKQRYNPRCLYGMNGVVVLVCQIFICPKGHFMTTTDPLLLSKFRERNCVPFLLFHRSGMTRHLSYFIFDMVSQGKSFCDIESLLLWRYQEHIAMCQMLYWYRHHTLAISGGMPTAPPLTDVPSLPVHLLSNDHIEDCFMTMYHDMQDYLVSTMSALTGECVSCDHTFKLAKHIGIMREGKWVPQYDSLFILQNERGEVLFWQLSMGTAYSVIQKGLQSLNTRMQQAGEKVKMIVIDNCCMWRRQLMATFDDVEVKLDVFHAVQRLSKALSKKHPYFYNCLQDFRLVFRSKGDNGPQRTKPTPSPSVLVNHLEFFIRKWNVITDEDKGPLFTLAVTAELENLKKHMERGCLSGIPPHFGTNRNENLHRSLNKRLSGNRIGVELAVAVIATFFHAWNQRRSGEENISTVASFLRTLTDNIQKCTDTVSPIVRPSFPTAQKFGIGISCQRQYSEECMGTAFSTEWSQDTAMQTMCKISGCQSLLLEPQTVTDNTITSDNIFLILHNAMSWIHLTQKLNQLSDTHAPITRLTTCSLGYLQNLEKEPDERIHEKRLGSVLESFQLQMVDVPRNGDCLFHSVACHLQHCLEDGDEQLLVHLQSLNIHASMSNCEIVKQLRALLVDEWLSNRTEYQPFFSEGMDFEDEAMQYLNLGTFSSELGDAMLLALSNVLRVAFIVFTSIESWPYVSIHPRVVPVHPDPFLLAFLQVGTGHYNLAVNKHTPTSTSQQCTVEPNSDQQLQASENTCRCGRGRNASDKERLNCSNKTNYSSRCPCLKGKSPCSTECRCVNCDNCFGKHSDQQPMGDSKPRKKRRRQPEQDMLRKGAIKFMKMEGERPLSGQWTPAEHYVFLGIINYLKSVRHITDMDNYAGMITNIYSTVLETIQKEHLSISLTAKSLLQIKAKIQQQMKEEHIAQSCGSLHYLPTDS